jgi:hypothetical protein
MMQPCNFFDPSTVTLEIRWWEQLKMYCSAQDSLSNSKNIDNFCSRSQKFHWFIWGNYVWFLRFHPLLLFSGTQLLHNSRSACNYVKEASPLLATFLIVSVIFKKYIKSMLWAWEFLLCYHIFLFHNFPDCFYLFFILISVYCNAYFWPL